MRFLSYKTCEKIHKLKIGVPSKWWWAVDSVAVGQRSFYGLFTRTPEKDLYMTYFHKAYTMDDIPAILLKLWKKTVNRDAKVSGTCIDIFTTMARIFAKDGWAAMEKEFNFIVDSHVKSSVYGKRK
jgi:hypothetical protein